MNGHPVRATSPDGGFHVLEGVPLRADVPRRLCVAVLLADRGRVLLARRAPGRAWFPGVWDLPGGHVEPGESVHAAAVREAREELGVEMDAAELVHLATFVERDLELVVLGAWTWRGVAANVETREHEAIGWFAPVEMSALHLADARIAGLAADALTAHRD